MIFCDIVSLVFCIVSYDVFLLLFCRIFQHGGTGICDSFIDSFPGFFIPFFLSVVLSGGSVVLSFLSPGPGGFGLLKKDLKIYTNIVRSHGGISLLSPLGYSISSIDNR